MKCCIQRMERDQRAVMKTDYNKRAASTLRTPQNCLGHDNTHTHTCMHKGEDVDKTTDTNS